MKILCVIDSLSSGGAQRQLVELALGFKEKNHEVSFLTYYHLPFYNSIVENAGIIITCINERNYFKRLLKMRHFIRQGKYHAVLSFLEAANFICEVAGLPYRDWRLVIGERSANPKILKSFKLRFYRWFHLLADYIVSNSHKNIELVRRINPLLSSKRCHVIYNMVDLEKWNNLQSYVPLKNGKFRLVVAASHHYVKNLNGVVEALSLLDAEEKEKLIIEWYGDNLNEPYIDNSLIEGRSKIKEKKLETLLEFFPATHNLPEIISEADGVGLFSLYEGFPNVVCEGMACSKPVICSKVSDIPLFLSYDRNLLFDPGQPVRIASSIKYLLKLDTFALETIGKTNRETAVIHFDKEIIINKYLKLLS